MTTEGFNIDLSVDSHTGFIVGGNTFNCLTWMDKMGSSAKSGNKGIPATPRAGAPVELVGLLYYCLSEYADLAEQAIYPYHTVVRKGKEYSYRGWANMIKEHF